MSKPIPFRGSVRAIGSAFEVAAVRGGREEAERRGIAPAGIAAVLEQDRQLATYMLGLLGSVSMDERRAGEMGVRRMVASLTETAA